MKLNFGIRFLSAPQIQNPMRIGDKDTTREKAQNTTGG